MNTRNDEFDDADSSRIAREVARERRERVLHDEQRTRLAPLDDRTKDARERFDTSNLKRQPGR